MIARAATLSRRNRTPDWLALLLRVALVGALFGIALAGHWFDRGGLRDNTDGQVNFVDVLYFTTVTVTTVGYGDIVPVTDRARLFDTLVVTPIRLFVWLIFLGTAYDFLFRRIWDKWRMGMIQRTLNGHVVLAGYGTSGAEALQELCRRGTDPAQVVVIDRTAAAVEAAKACGATVMEGDATRNATLEAARIDRARALIVAAGHDDTSILIVLTARGLAPALPISVVVRAQDNVPLARQAGAGTVINPAHLAGQLLAGSTEGGHAAAYFADLAAYDGRVALRERPVAADEIGRPLAAIRTGLGLRVHRGAECHGFWAPEAQALEANDVVVEVVPNGEANHAPPR